MWKRKRILNSEEPNVVSVTLFLKRIRQQNTDLYQLIVYVLEGSQHLFFPFHFGLERGEAGRMGTMYFHSSIESFSFNFHIPHSTPLLWLCYTSWHVELKKAQNENETVFYLSHCLCFSFITKAMHSHTIETGSI